MTPFTRSTPARALTALTALLILTASSRVEAQDAPSDFRHATTLGAFGGVAKGAPASDASFGATVGWLVTPHFDVEARGFWVPAGVSREAFAATLGVRVSPTPGRTVAPFVSGGVGMFRAIYDGEAQGVPDFYARRIAPSPGLTRNHRFDDLAFAVGGGADIAVAERVTVRPEVTVLLVTADSHVRPVTAYGVQVAYHFQFRRITP